MNNMNFDENTINKLKNMMDKGELNDVISQISPEMIQNFSSMMGQAQASNANRQNNNNNNNIGRNNSNNGNHGHNNNSNFNGGNNSSNNSNFAGSSNSNGGFDFSNIDMNTILKMKSVMEKMNSSNDPRSNLLNSLKPYLREERRGKVDQYANLLNVAKVAELLKNENNNKENH